MSRIDSLSGDTGVLERIHTEAFPPALSFLDIAAKFSGDTGTVVLMSGGDSDSARYNILAVNPWLTIRSRDARSKIVLPHRTVDVTADPLDLLQEIAGQYRAQLDFLRRAMPKNLAAPIAAGLFGYLAYDLKDLIETLPRTTVDDLGLPHLCMYAPSAILVEDRITGGRQLHIPVRKKGESDSYHDDRRAFFDRIDSQMSEFVGFSTDHKGFSSSFSRKTYMTGVEKIRDYIISGHIYQVNLSQRFEGAFHGCAFAMFKTLFEKAPAPFYAYVNAGDHRIVSTSPERFLRQSGRHVESRPIKGTRPRGKTGTQDRDNARELLNSAKDDAELSMIVDLVRNDLGRVCQAGSVRVAEHRRLEPYKNVFHLVSIVKGALVAEKDSVDLIRAAFPGGSITGCPRIRAMEIIDEMEPCRRHIYTGSIGYISFHETMDLSIAIRTATITGGRICFSVGGGVVFDSDPADEYEETLHKGGTIMGLFEKQNGGGPETTQSMAQPVAWFNGAIVPTTDVRFHATDKGVMYGYGFFETIRASHGEPAYVDAHVARFNRAWEALFETTPPDVTWSEIIRQVISENRLENTLSTVKITAACIEDGESGPFSANMVVTAAPSRHRLDVLQKMGLDLAVYPRPRETPLANHKTLNYLYYYLAGKWARREGADEAVILNPDGSVSETNTANMICISGREAILPASAHVLSGIMAAQAAEYLRENGYGITRKRIMPDDLPGFDAVILTNSLMGAVPAIGLDGAPMRSEPGLCSQINKVVL